MVIDLLLSLAIIAGSLGAGFAWVRWDMHMERRARQKFDAELEAIVRKRESDV